MPPRKTNIPPVKIQAASVQLQFEGAGGKEFVNLHAVDLGANAIAWNILISLGFTINVTYFLQCLVMKFAHENEIIYENNYV